MWTVQEAEEFWKAIAKNQREEIVRLREALEFYADEDKYYYQPSEIGLDNGKTARQALSI